MPVERYYGDVESGLLLFSFSLFLVVVVVPKKRLAKTCPVDPSRPRPIDAYGSISHDRAILVNLPRIRSQHVTSDAREYMWQIHCLLDRWWPRQWSWERSAVMWCCALARKRHAIQEVGAMYRDADEGRDSRRRKRGKRQRKRERSTRRPDKSGWGEADWRRGKEREREREDGEESMRNRAEHRSAHVCKCTFVGVVRTNVCWRSDANVVWSVQDRPRHCRESAAILGATRSGERFISAPTYRSTLPPSARLFSAYYYY